MEGDGRSGDLFIAFNDFPSPALISNVEPYVVNYIKLIQQGLIGVSTPAEVSSFFTTFVISILSSLPQVGGIGGTFIDEMIVCEEMSYR